MFPFHLSIAVADKEATKRFYVDVLECPVGRDGPDWCDILFFGHQLTLHQARPGLPARGIDHFGAILDKATWHRVMSACEKAGLVFVMRPVLRSEGRRGKWGKFLIEDPAGNKLEFKC